MSASRDPDDAPFEREPWSVGRVLRDGTAVTLRPLHADDKEAFREAFRGLSPATRYLRFFSVVTEPSEHVLRYLTDVDQHDHVAIAATVTSADLKTERGVGVARFVRAKDAPAVAEAAVTVVDEFQGRGLGALLLVELARAALARGVHTFRGEVLATNQPMLGILRSVGATLSASEDAAGPPSEGDLPALRRERAGSQETATLGFAVPLRGGGREGERAHEPHDGLLEIVRAAAASMASRLRGLVSAEGERQPASTRRPDVRE
ncbi:MAG: GNAT family N-acetyltransferase [Myxococcales bacterium]|jgi:GNAT superfamily N-acetyltransferase|nr:GNAT family N-acetyltransferase [Myxococcales bacterium]MBL0194686.1 GNAT family N-acetyltransferase [Myxococcales bacterium]HQY63740.1 GNAT family N-acetyltransferase [Polyangiaceae bacterium]